MLGKSSLVIGGNAYPEMQLHVVDVVNLSFAHVLPQRTQRSAFFSSLEKGSREARKRERDETAYALEFMAVRFLQYGVAALVFGS